MFLEACRQAAIDPDISDSIERLIWEKFAFMVGLSGTTTTMRQSIGSVRENERTRSFLLDLMREVVEVGRARGIAVPEDYAQDRLAFCDTLPASMTSSMHSGKGKSFGTAVVERWSRPAGGDGWDRNTVQPRGYGDS
jgi:2-dehydropantoate 2-reductase